MREREKKYKELLRRDFLHFFHFINLLKGTLMARNDGRFVGGETSSERRRGDAGGST